MPQDRARLVSRRSVLAGIGGVAAAALLPGGLSLSAEAAEAHSLYAPQPALETPPSVSQSRPDPQHLAWVWQFEADGDPAKVREMLAAHGLGIALKTHDGTNWMGRYSKTGASNPAGVEGIVRYFEQGGVPVHAWAVVKGQDPLKEAQMAADVLSAGARSLFLDLESHEGFWQGTNRSAMQFGTELRRRRPSSWVSTSIDSRPWELPRIPLTEFASFTDEIAPQTYWNLFKSASNVKAYQKSGDFVPAAGVTAAFVIESAMRHLRSYGRPIHPIGDGTPGSLSGWNDFINGSYTGDAETVSVWRYGVADPAIWRLLKDTPPKSSSYLVQRGDSLPVIATRLNTTVPALLAENASLTQSAVSMGMRLRVPAGTAKPKLAEDVRTPRVGLDLAARSRLGAPKGTLKVNALKPQR